MKCIRILGHKWIHLDSEQINVFSACHNFKTNCNDLAQKAQKGGGVPNCGGEGGLYHM